VLSGVAAAYASSVRPTVAKPVVPRSEV